MDMTHSLSLRLLSLMYLIPAIALVGDIINNWDTQSIFLYLPLLATLIIVALGVYASVFIAKQNASISALILIVLTAISVVISIITSFETTHVSPAYGILSWIAAFSLICINIPLSIMCISMLKKIRVLSVTVIIYCLLSAIMFIQYLLRSMFGEANDVLNAVKVVPWYLSMDVFYVGCGILAAVGLVIAILVWKKVPKIFL